ncbi:MAG TPA: hypothetical protein VFG10_12935 [Saprospiraceae bacterium]|nr:hypothetical protein [Saprospiraceae bacterium]
MKLYNLSVAGMIIRFHLLTAFIVTMGFLGYLYVGIVLGMVVFLSTIVGLQIKREPVVERIAETKEYFPSVRAMHMPKHRYNLWHQKHHWAMHS